MRTRQEKEWQRAANKDNGTGRTPKNAHYVVQRECVCCLSSLCVFFVCSEYTIDEQKCNARTAIAHYKTAQGLLVLQPIHCIVRHLWPDFYFVFRFYLWAGVRGNANRRDRFPSFYFIIICWLTRVTLTTSNSKERHGKKKPKTFSNNIPFTQTAIFYDIMRY